MGGVWSWWFNNPMELRHALESYAVRDDNTAMRQREEDRHLETDASGHTWVVDGEGNRSEPEIVTKSTTTAAMIEMEANQKRAEIDACLEGIRLRYPHYHRLLDKHYRRGCSLDPRGWLVPAGLLGIHEPRCQKPARCPVSPGDNRSDLDTCKRDIRFRCREGRADFVTWERCAILRLWAEHKKRRNERSEEEDA